MSTALTRRRLLVTALAAAGAAVPLGAGRASAQPRITLPAPTGPYRIGTRPLHLVDRSRPDPIAGPGRFRELMASVWYPATWDARRYPPAPWMPAAPLRELLASADFDPGIASPLTAGHVGAPPLRTLGRLPVVLYSHGAGGHRSETTIVVQELASHGYVVVTVDHTYDAYTEFPGGRLSLPDDNASATPWDNSADVRFVLDHLEKPNALSTVLDLRRVGMFGFSKGGTATALTMNVDPRVRAGLTFDGLMQSQPPVTGVDRPFLMLAAELTRDAEASVEQFWSQLSGWHRYAEATGARHGAYCDHQWLIPQLAAISGTSAADLDDWIGTFKPAHAVRVQQLFPRAFFDLHLRHRGQLPAAPAPDYPELHFRP